MLSLYVGCVKYARERHRRKLVRSLCQGCRSLSRKERCPGSTTWRWIYFAPLIFDNKVNWKNHADKIVSRVSKRTDVLKSLAGSKWGCVRPTLNLTYQKYILPVITYSCESLVTAQPHKLTVLEHAQNQT